MLISPIALGLFLANRDRRVASERARQTTPAHGPCGFGPARRATV